jgi:hypothetical protein
MPTEPIRVRLAEVRRSAEHERTVHEPVPLSPPEYGLRGTVGAEAYQLDRRVQIYQPK